MHLSLILSKGSRIFSSHGNVMESSNFEKYHENIRRNLENENFSYCQNIFKPMVNYCFGKISFFGPKLMNWEDWEEFSHHNLTRVLVTLKDTGQNSIWKFAKKKPLETRHGILLLWKIGNLEGSSTRTIT